MFILYNVGVSEHFIFHNKGEECWNQPKFKAKLSLVCLCKLLYNICFKHIIISKQKIRMDNREFVCLIKALCLFLGHLSYLPPVGSGTELHSASLTTHSPQHHTKSQTSLIWHQPARQKQITTHFNPTSGQFRLTLINATSTLTHHRLSDWICTKKTFIKWETESEFSRN